MPRPPLFSSVLQNFVKTPMHRFQTSAPPASQAGNDFDASSAPLTPKAPTLPAPSPSSFCGGSNNGKGFICEVAFAQAGQAISDRLSVNPTGRFIGVANIL